jgi:hypothetical protein
MLLRFRYFLWNSSVRSRRRRLINGKQWQGDAASAWNIEDVFLPRLFQKLRGFSSSFSKFLLRHLYFTLGSDLDMFDEMLTPGPKAPVSGVYCCEGCHREVTPNGGDPLPPQNHHQHDAQKGEIRWRLIVWAAGNQQ